MWQVIKCIDSIIYDRCEIQNFNRALSELNIQLMKR